MIQAIGYKQFMKHLAPTLLLFAVAITTPAAAAETRSVVELFTSQGC